MRSASFINFGPNLYLVGLLIARRSFYQWVLARIPCCARYICLPKVLNSTPPWFFLSHKIGRLSSSIWSSAVHCVANVCNRTSHKRYCVVEPVCCANQQHGTSFAINNLLRLAAKVFNLLLQQPNLFPLQRDTVCCIGELQFPKRSLSFNSGIHVAWLVRQVRKIKNRFFMSWIKHLYRSKSMEKMEH